MHTVDIAAHHGHDSVVSALTAGASVDQARRRRHTVLIAAQNGHDSVVSVYPRVRVSTRRENGCTPLMIAALMATIVW